MATTHISTKGQVIIPQPIRKRLGWNPGDDVHILVKADRVILTKIVIEPPAKRAVLRDDDYTPQELANMLAHVKGMKMKEIPRSR